MKTDKKILTFIEKYAELAPKGNVKNLNIKRLSEIYLDLKKVQLHISLNRYYFLINVSDDRKYLKSIIDILPKTSLDFYKRGYYDVNYIKQFGLHKTKIPDNIIYNFNLAKNESMLGIFSYLCEN